MTNSTPDPIAAATARRIASYAELAPIDDLLDAPKRTTRRRSRHSVTHSLGMNGKRRSRDAR